MASERDSMKKTILALLAAFAATSAAQAQTTSAATAPKAYVGVGVGAAVGAGEHKGAAKIFGGYEFDQNWGIEAGYTRFRNADFYYGNGDGFLGKGTIRSYGAYVAGKYSVPINENFSAYGKLGLSHSERELSAGSAWTYTERDTGLYGGLGVQYKLSDYAAVVAEYERYGKRKESGPRADVVSVGLKYSF
jgi:opacity protein-like surface antigen